MRVEIADDDGIFAGGDDASGDFADLMTMGGGRGIDVGKLQPFVLSQFHAKGHNFRSMLGFITYPLKYESLLDEGDEAAAVHGFSVISEAGISWNTRGGITETKFGFLYHADVDVFLNQTVLEFVNFCGYAISIPLDDFERGLAFLRDFLRN